MRRSIDCLAAVSVAALFVLGGGWRAAASGVEPDGGPTAVVSAVVKLDNGRDWAPVFDSKPTALMRRYFTEAFNASWANAMTHNNEEPVLDGDPITGGQGIQSLALRSVRLGSASGDAATVLAVLAVRTEGVARSNLSTVRFSLRREGGSWRIDDIGGGVDGTLRTHFRKSYGQ